LIRDPENVYQIVKAVRAATSKPLSVKIRIGWDKQTITGLAVAEAVEKAGADWLTVHGRLRNDDYSVPVDLEAIAAIKQRVSIPVIGNGNIFSRADADFMRERTGVDGVMVSRGALGNPWVFQEIADGSVAVSLDEWHRTVTDHLTWQQEEYGDGGGGAVCMRKHLLWYVKGWPGARRLRERMTQVSSLDEARGLIDELAHGLRAEGCLMRQESVLETGSSRFNFDPKWDMDRRLDRGVGDDLMSTNQ
jgi:tRNA-dihydrouridine synthase